MDAVNLFETATRTKYRFPTNRGELGVEQLWDLSLDSLDSIGMNLAAELKEVEGGSLRRKATKGNATQILQNKFDLVKHIITTKEDEAEAKRNAAVVQANNARIDEVIAQKKDAALLDMTVEELEKMKQ